MKYDNVNSYTKIPSGYVLILHCVKCNRLIEFAETNLKNPKFNQINHNTKNWFWEHHSEVHHQIDTTDLEKGWLVKIIRMKKGG